MELEREKLKTIETETFEISFYLLFRAKKKLQLGKKESKILTTATRKKSKTFQELKSLTKNNKNGKYTPFILLEVILKNQSILSRIIKEDQILKGKTKLLHSEKPNREKLTSDLKLIEEPFHSSLLCLNREMKSLKIPSKNKKILIAAKVKRDNKEKLLYNRLKNLTNLNKSGKCTPFEILETIRKNRPELTNVLEGKPTEIGQITKGNKQNKTNLPLDTDYKYPTKSSKSIWTVKKK